MLVKTSLENNNIDRVDSNLDQSSSFFFFLIGLRLEFWYGLGFEHGPHLTGPKDKIGLKYSG